jgi:hypothetical protein
MAYTSSPLDRQYQTISRREVVEIARRNLQTILGDSRIKETYTEEKDVLNQSLKQIISTLEEEKGKLVDTIGENFGSGTTIPDPSSETFEEDTQALLNDDSDLANFLNTSFNIVRYTSELLVNLVSKTGIIPSEFRESIITTVSISGSILLFMFPLTRGISVALSAVTFAKFLFESFSEQSIGVTIADFLENV